MLVKKKKKMKCKTKKNGMQRGRTENEHREGRFYAELHTKTFTIFSHVLTSYSEKNTTKHWFP